MHDPHSAALRPAAVFFLCSSFIAWCGGCAPQIPPIPPAPVASASHAGSDAAEAGKMDRAIEMDLAGGEATTCVVPVRTYRCSAEAERIGAAADEHAAADRLGEARAAYAGAIALCPANAHWWIHAGDVELRSGDTDRAREMLEHGLAIDPWDREGHRFLSYALAAAGDDEQSWRHAVLAVLSDPGCETGWTLLERATSERGGAFHRGCEKKPVARATYGHLDLDLDSSPAVARSPGWAAYAIGLGTREARLAYLTQRPAPGQKTTAIRPEKIDECWARWRPLERERWLVQQALEHYPASDDRARGDAASRTWPAIHSAAGQGYLDEAIFVQLLDGALVPEFVEFRRAHAERLFDYVTGFVAVLPSGVGKRRVSSTALLAPEPMSGMHGARS